MVSTRRQANQTSPDSGTRMPARQCSRVDLPDPLGPIMARISPAATETLAPRSAGVVPNERCRSVASMACRASGTGRRLAVVIDAVDPSMTGIPSLTSAPVDKPAGPHRLWPTLRLIQKFSKIFLESENHLYASGAVPVTGAVPTAARSGWAPPLEPARWSPGH